MKMGILSMLSRKPKKYRFNGSNTAAKRYSYYGRLDGRNPITDRRKPYYNYDWLNIRGYKK